MADFANVGSMGITAQTPFRPGPTPGMGQLNQSGQAFNNFSNQPGNQLRYQQPQQNNQRGGGGGQIQGANTQGQNKPSGGGGWQTPTGGGFGDPNHPDLSNPYKQNLFNQWKGQQPQAPDTSVFDKMIEPVIQNFESLIGTQQQTTANTVGGMNKQRQTELDTQNQQFAGQQQDLSRQTTQQTDETNNAVEEAKRMYAEMSQGNLARYGSTTGTGAFLNEQLGQSTGRNIALLHQGLSQHLQDINDKITQIKQTGELAIRGTNERFDQAIQTEQDNLQKFIGQIKGNEAMLQSNKAQMAAQAIQHFQDTVTNINAQRAQEQQQWAIATLNAQTQLKIYGQKGQSALSQIQQQGAQSAGLATNLNTGLANSQNTTVNAPATPQDRGSLPNQNPLNAFQQATS
ncbi:MAG TPA: hypothetical protein VF974_07650 [Patescibacteria group bacterium]